MIGNYIYGAQAVLLVYDITNYEVRLDLEPHPLCWPFVESLQRAGCMD